MQITINPTRRSFDHRMVFVWEVTDSRGRLRDTGVELTAASAQSAAKRAVQWLAPDRLLDMLECRHD